MNHSKVCRAAFAIILAIAILLSTLTINVLTKEDFPAFMGSDVGHQPFSLADNPTPSTAFRLNGNWSRLNLVPSPSPRAGAAVVYDVSDGYTLVFGGCVYTSTSKCYLTNETWMYENGIWTNLTPSLRISPPPMEQPAIVYDSADGYVLLFGGTTPTLSNYLLNYSWTFQNGVWTNISDAARPTPLGGDVSMTYDAADGYVLLFGSGCCYGILDGENQTWWFRGGTWTRLPNGPYKADSASLAYDPSTGYVVLIGGEYGGGPFCYNSTWKFIAGSWSELPVVRSPACFFAGSLTYDASLRSLVYFGGEDGTATTYNTTWTFAGGDWTQWATTVSPPAQDYPGVAFDATDNFTLLFGSTYLNSTWRFPAPPLHPPPTYSVTLSESGLLAGTSWSVTLNGTTKSGTGSIGFIEPNGSYSFAIGSVNGYSASPSSGPLTVSGAAVSKTITFTPTSSKTGFLGLSGNLGYIVVGVIVAMVVAAVAALFLLKRKPRPGGSAKSEERGSSESPDSERPPAIEPSKPSGEEAKPKG